MDAAKLKKKLKQQNPLMTSPMAFALAACGGGGGEEEISPALSSIRTLGPTGDDAIDLVTSGSYYRSSATSPIFYGLAHGHYGERWENPDNVADVLQDVMAEFNQYADMNLKFAGIYESPNAASDAGVSVVLSFDQVIAQSTEGVDAWAVSFPATTINSQGIDNIGGNVRLNYNSHLWNADSQADFESAITTTDYGFAVLLHAFGSALGLKSTYNSTDGTRPIIENTIFAEDADDPSLSASNISYESMNETVGSSLGILDVVGLMYLYGPNLSTNAGDNNYQIPSISGYHLIYDAAGIDTIVVNETVGDVVVILPDGTFTEAEFGRTFEFDVGGVFTEDQDTDAAFFTALYGTIENVTTGSGNDTIFGNSQNNIINAGSGDDFIALSQGIDIIYGGEGSDQYWVQAPDNNLVYLGTNTIIKDFEIGIDTLLVGSGNSALAFTQNEDGYATYTNDAGAYVVLEGIEANVLLIA